ncbi:MAG: hypothetical protein N2171_01350 [Clostridia bacterium]|nr:hypothetical protein [Clostridia bacterium]
MKQYIKPELEIMSFQSDVDIALKEYYYNDGSNDIALFSLMDAPTS